MLTMSLMSDLQATRFRVSELEKQALKVSAELAAAQEQYNTISYLLQQAYSQELHLQSASILVTYQLLQGQYATLLENISAEIHRSLAKISTSLTELRDKKFLKHEVRLNSILYLSIRYLTFRYKLEFINGTMDPYAASNQQIIESLTILHDISNTQLPYHSGIINKLLLAAGVLKDYGILQTFSMLGLKADTNEVVMDLISKVKPDDAPYVQILQTFLNHAPTSNEVVAEDAQSEAKKIAEKIEADLTQQRLAAEQREAERKEQERIAAEKLAAEQRAAEKLEKKRLAAEKRKLDAAKREKEQRDAVIKPSEPKKDEWTLVTGGKKVKERAPVIFSAPPVDEHKKTAVKSTVVASTIEQAVTEQSSTKTLVAEMHVEEAPKLTSAAPKSSVSEIKSKVAAEEPTTKTIISRAVDSQDVTVLNEYLAKEQTVPTVVSLLAKKFSTNSDAVVNFIAKLNLPLSACYTLFNNIKINKACRAHVLDKILAQDIETFAKHYEKQLFCEHLKEFLCYPLSQEFPELNVKIKDKTAEMQARNKARLDKIFVDLKATRSDKNFDELKLKQIIGHVNEAGQSPLMVAIEGKLNTKTILFLIEHAGEQVSHRDNQKRNVLDYWAMYNPGNVNYIRELWSKLWQLCGANRMHTFLYRQTDIDENTWLHHLVNNNSISEQVALTALNAISDLVKKELLQAAVFTKNKARETPNYILESKTEFWPSVINELIIWVTKTAPTLSENYESGQPFFSTDSGFYNKQVMQPGQCNTSDPVYDEVNTKNVLRLTEVVASRYRLRSVLVETFRKKHGRALNPNDFTSKQLKVIQYFDCDPMRMELMQIVGSDNTLYGLIMDRIAQEYNADLEQLASQEVYQYMNLALPVCESLAWKKAKRFAKGEPVTLTEENINEIKAKVNKSIKTSSALYIGSKTLTGQDQEMLPIELAMMDGDLRFIKFLCETCGAKVTDDSLLRAFWLAEESFGELQEYVLSQHPAGKSKAAAAKMAADIYVLEVYTNPSAQKVDWLMQHNFFPTELNKNGDNLLHAIIHAIANNRLDVNHFLSFIQIISRRLDIIASLMDWCKPKGNYDYMSLLEGYLQNKQITETQYKQIACSLVITRTRLEGQQQAPQEQSDADTARSRLVM